MSVPWGLGVLAGEGQGHEEGTASAWSWLGMGAWAAGGSFPCDMEVPYSHLVSFCVRVLLSICHAWDGRCS